MFVGRVIPNKKFENVIRAFHAYRTRHNPRSRLLLVGSYGGFERYLAMLQSLIAKLGTPDVHFLGHVSERGADGALRRRRPVPLRQRARGLLRADHRGVPQAGAGAGLRRHRRARDHGRRRRALRHHRRASSRAAHGRVLDDHRLEDAILASQDAALARLLAQDFAGTLLRYVAALLAAGPRQAPEVAWDFWAQFEQFERLEELRQFRPALFRALPAPPARPNGTRDPRLGIRRSARINGAQRGTPPPPVRFRAPGSRVPSPESRQIHDHQPVGPGGPQGDAIGDSARGSATCCGGAGHASDLFALTIDDDLRDDVRPFADPEARRGDVTIFHFALPSPMTEAFAALPGGGSCSTTTSPRRTSSPATTPQLFRLAALGRQRAATLVGHVDLALGDSEFNRQELEALGFAPTGVMPIAVNTERITDAPRRPALERILGDGLINILFVGRIAPNKRIEDHIRLAEIYKRYVDSYYRFIFVGRYDGVPALLRAGPRADRRVPDAARPLLVHRPGAGRGSRRLLPLGGRLRFAERARGLLRAAGRGDGRRRAGARLCRRRGAGDAGRRRLLFAPKDLEFAAEMLGLLVYDRRSADAGARGPAPAAAGLCARRDRRAARRSAREDHRLKIAFIVQRYGTEILGGSEYHCRLIAERLAPRHAVEVLTTCAADYITWKNEYPEGTDRIRGVTVRRFANAQTRDLDAFNRYSEWIFNNPHTRSDEMEWLRQQGPWCPALLEYLERNHQQYDVLIFFTYLYAPTVLGVRIAPEKSILVPTAHDEPAIRLDIYKELFSAPAAIAYNTEVERRFLTTHFSIRAIEEETVGCGVDLPQAHP